MYVSTNSQSPFFKVEFKNPVTISKIKWVKKIAGLDNDYGAKVGVASADFSINYIGDNKTTKNIEISDEDCKVVENIFSPYHLIKYMMNIFIYNSNVLIPLKQIRHLYVSTHHQNIFRHHQILFVV